MNVLVTGHEPTESTLKATERFAGWPFGSCRRWVWLVVLALICPRGAAQERDATRDSGRRPMCRLFRVPPKEWTVRVEITVGEKEYWGASLTDEGTMSVWDVTWEGLPEAYWPRVGSVPLNERTAIFLTAAEAVNRFTFEHSEQKKELPATVRLTLKSGLRTVSLEESNLERPAVRQSFAWNLVTSLNAHLPAERRDTLNLLIKTP